MLFVMHLAAVKCVKLFIRAMTSLSQILLHILTTNHLIRACMCGITICSCMRRQINYSLKYIMHIPVGGFLSKFLLCVWKQLIMYQQLAYTSNNCMHDSLFPQ